jgi:hypothetical protein
VAITIIGGHRTFSGKKRADSSPRVPATAGWRQFAKKTGIRHDNSDSSSNVWRSILLIAAAPWLLYSEPNVPQADRGAKPDARIRKPMNSKV